MFFIWRKIAEDKHWALLKISGLADIPTARLLGGRMWRTREMSDILLTSLTEVCHQDVMLKDQKVFLVKRLPMGVVLLWCVLCLCWKLLTGNRMSVQLPTVELQCNIPVCTITGTTSKSVTRNPRQNF